jgi:hypothetical protein
MISVNTVELPALPPTHLGTSKNGTPWEFDELLVAPSSVTTRVSDPLMPAKTGGKFFAKLYEITDPAIVSHGPRYFAVGFRFGITDIRCVNIFCHPNPGHAGMNDNDYVGLNGNWSRLYRYIQYFGVQLASGASNMVLVMPMFNNATWGNLGNFRMKWHDIVNGILVEVQKIAWPDKPGQVPMDRNQNALADVILSDFSAGRYVVNALRGAPQMGTFLREIWDFDGAGGVAPSSPRHGQVLVYNQAPGGLARNLFHVPLSRWVRFPFYTSCLKDKERNVDSLHGHIPQRLFYHATTISLLGH